MSWLNVGIVRGDMIALYIIAGVIGVWFFSGFITGLIVITSINSFLEHNYQLGELSRPTLTEDIKVLLACGILGLELTVECIIATFKS